MPPSIPMTQEERRRYLIRFLLRESSYAASEIPDSPDAQAQLLRGLLNMRPPQPAPEEFLQVQDAYLTERSKERSVVCWHSLTPVKNALYLWQGDITRLAVDAIVNAANDGMTGCYQPNHTCIDNCIHTFSGVQLRLECARLMRLQGHKEPVGQAKITSAYNLPAQYVLHTVGPCIHGTPTQQDKALLAACYRSCMRLAAENNLESIAFCCISTGVFRFPAEQAAVIAVTTVQECLQQYSSLKAVIFTVFTEQDRRIYERLLGGAGQKYEESPQ